MLDSIISIVTALMPFLKGFPNIALAIGLAFSAIPVARISATTLVSIWHDSVVFLNVVSVFPPLKGLATFAAKVSVEETTIDDGANKVIAFLDKLSLIDLPMNKSVKK
jgi:hypothetical protein